MLFSLLATRVLTRNVVASSAFILRRPPLPRIIRSFSVSRVTWAPAATAKVTPSAKKTVAEKPPARKSAKKPAVKNSKATKAAPKAKKKVAKKSVVRIKIKPGDQPPKAPGGPYLVFHSKRWMGAERMEGEPQMEFAKRVATESGASWNALPEQEKQSFRDEFSVAREEYKKKMEDYIKNTDPAIIREINKRRAKQGKKVMIHIKRGNISSFFAFLMEERANTQPLPGLIANREFVKEASKKWRTLSDEEKLSYKEKGKAITESRQH